MSTMEEVMLKIRAEEEARFAGYEAKRRYKLVGGALCGACHEPIGEEGVEECEVHEGKTHCPRCRPRKSETAELTPAWEMEYAAKLLAHALCCECGTPLDLNAMHDADERTVHETCLVKMATDDPLGG